MMLIAYLVLYWPVYFAVRHLIDLPEPLAAAGFHVLITLVATFAVVAALFWGKHRISG